jgi:hypothetical protein
MALPWQRTEFDMLIAGAWFGNAKRETPSYARFMVSLPCGQYFDTQRRAVRALTSSERSKNSMPCDSPGHHLFVRRKL